MTGDAQGIGFSVLERILNSDSYVRVRDPRPGFARTKRLDAGSAIAGLAVDIGDLVREPWVRMNAKAKGY